MKNSKNGKTYVKLVNALPLPVKLTVNGLDIPTTAKSEGFDGKPEEQKLNIKTEDVGSEITLPAYSLRIIEL